MTSDRQGPDGPAAAQRPGSTPRLAGSPPGRPRWPLGARILLALWSLLIELATWSVLAPWTVLRAPAGQRRRRLAQRLGRWHGDDVPTPGVARRPRVLVHAAGVGEIAAASPLVCRLAARLGAVSGAVLWSTQTASGLERARGLRPPGVAVGLLPFDRRHALRDWLADHRVGLVVLIEVELWPGLLAACHDLDLPVVWASARLHPGDLSRYHAARLLLAPLLHPLLAGLALVAAQSPEAASEILALGAPRRRLVVGGDLKRDRALELVGARAQAPGGGSPTDGGQRYGPGDRGQRGDGSAAERPLRVVAASTHGGEETHLLRAWRELVAARAVATTTPAVELVLAPRDPRRAAGVVQRARRLGLAAQIDGADPASDRPAYTDRAGTRPSLAGQGPPIRVLARYGTLDAALAAADLVILGGSLGGAYSGSVGAGSLGGRLGGRLGDRLGGRLRSRLVGWLDGLLGDWLGGQGAHDPWPAAALGKPLLVGPRHGAAASSLRPLLAAGAALPAAAPSGLARQLASLLAAPAELARRGAAGRLVARGGDPAGSQDPEDSARGKPGSGETPTSGAADLLAAVIDTLLARRGGTIPSG